MNEKERRAFERLFEGALKDANDRYNPHAEIAKMLRSMHEAFMNEGFDNDEAFTLVVTILEAQMSMTRG